MRILEDLSTSAISDDSYIDDTAMRVLRSVIREVAMSQTDRQWVAKQDPTLLLLSKVTIVFENEYVSVNKY